MCIRDSSVADFARHHKAVPVAQDFKYSSDNNTEWLTVDEIRDAVIKHVDANFTPTF